MEKKNYTLPDHRQEGKRSRAEVIPAYDAFHLSEEMRGLGLHKTYYLHTYGCQANVRDGETLRGMLEEMQFTSADTLENADVLIFNTCAIRKSAEEHVIGEIGALKGLKEKNPDKIICLCGCMAQEESVVRLLMKRYPQVDIIFGTHNLYRFPELLYQYTQSQQRQIEVESQEGGIVENLPVSRSLACKGYVNIMYGCNKFCTYCIVPYTRGKERSRREEDILKEVKELQASGAKEVVLLGQNVNAYGKDLGMDDGFTHLLETIAETGIPRIRFYTSHPRDYSVSTIEAMQKHPNIMPALHLPVQSGNTEVLKRMNRGYSRETYLDLVAEMKKRIPSITFTTDIIVGFPGETDAQFRDTLSLVDICQFDGAYTFVFSPREGTPAAGFTDPTPAAEKKARLQELNEHVSHWARVNSEPYQDRTVKVLCEGKSKHNDAVYCGYSEENKLVNFTCDHDCTNEIVPVKITEVHSFSLNGKALADL